MGVGDGIRLEVIIIIIITNIIIVKRLGVNDRSGPEGASVWQQQGSDVGGGYEEGRDEGSV